MKFDKYNKNKISKISLILKNTPEIINFESPPSLPIYISIFLVQVSLTKKDLEQNTRERRD